MMPDPCSGALLVQGAAGLVRCDAGEVRVRTKPDPDGSALLVEHAAGFARGSE